MNIYYVYQLRIEGDILPFYIGKGKNDRAYAHFRQGSLRVRSYKNSKIKGAQQAGKEILVEFIKTGLSEDDAHLWEYFWIAEFGRYDLGLGPLTNGTDGGDGVSGAIRSDETRAKMSASKIGWTHSDETKERMSELKKGVKRSDEYCMALSERMKGDNNPLSGAHSAEHRDKHAKAVSKDWIITHPDGKVEIVRNLEKFCRDTGLGIASMRQVANGWREKHKGYGCRRQDQ